MFWHDVMEGLLFPASMPTLWHPHQRGLLSDTDKTLPVDGMWLRRAKVEPKARLLFLGSMTHGIYHHLQKIEVMTDAGFEVLLWTPSCAKPGQLMSLGALCEDACRVLAHERAKPSSPLILYGEGVGAYAWMQACRPQPEASLAGFVAVGLWTSIRAWAQGRYGTLVGKIVEKGFPDYPSPERIVPTLRVPYAMFSTRDDGASPAQWAKVGVRANAIDAPTEAAFLKDSTSIVAVLNDWFARSREASLQ